MTPPDSSHRPSNSPSPAPAPAPIPVAAVASALRIEYVDPRGLPRRRSWRAILESPAFWPIRAFCWVVLGVAMVGGLAGLVGGAFGSSPLSVMTGLLALLLLTSVAVLLRNLRRDRAQAVLAYLEQAVRLNLPLPAMLLAAERAETPALRRRLRRLRERLEEGRAVSAALDAAATGLPARAVGLIDAGEHTGRLADALHRLVRQERAAPRTDPSGDILLRWYPLVMFFGLCGAASVLALFVVPKMISILKDFHMPVPAVTQLLYDYADWLAVLPFVGGAAVLVSLGRMTAQMLSPRLARYSPWRGLTDRLAWYLPPARGLARSRGLADACNVLADALSAGHAPHQALAEAAALPVNAVLRRRLRRWGWAAEGGAALADGARAAGMPALVAGMLSSARAADGAEQVLRFLARHYESRFSRAAQLLRSAVVPALAVGFGALVAGLALAIFLPLVELIDKLTPGAGGPM